MKDPLLAKFGIESEADEPAVSPEEHKAALSTLAEAGFSPADLEAVDPASVVRIAQSHKPAPAKAEPAKAAKAAPAGDEPDVRDRALARLIDFDLERRVQSMLGAGATPEQVAGVVERTKRLMQTGDYQHPDEPVREAVEIHRARAVAEKKEPVRERSAVAGLGSLGTRSATREAPSSLPEWQREWVNAKASGASQSELAAIESRRPEPPGIRIYT